MLTSDQIELMAEQFRTHMGISSVDRPDMVALVYAMRERGMIKDVEVFPAGTLGASEANYDPDSQVAHLSSGCITHQEPKHRFTIAHEIGHYLAKHKHIRHRRLDHRQQFGRQTRSDETEANKIAAALLVPETLANVDMSTTATEIALRFNVSLVMAELRLADLQERHRIKNGVRRRALPKVRWSASGKIEYEPVAEFDSGDYEQAFPQMLRHAKKHNSD